MPNPEGTPIWYELLTADPIASKRFYDHVIGWTVDPEPMGPGMDDRGIGTADGSMVGGMMRLTDEMAAGGAKPTWLFFIGVDVVDASFAKAKANGGGELTAPFDIPGAGRAAMVTDPTGAPFYIMRGSSPENSTAWDRTGMGKCNWNELISTAQARANAFYADTFGWTYPDKMPMGEWGDYIFIDAAGQTIGANMQQPPSDPSPAGWRFYFRTPDIEATAKKVVEAGGTMVRDIMEVPGGDRVLLATDPHGVLFGAVGPGNQ